MYVNLSSIVGGIKHIKVTKFKKTWGGEPGGVGKCASIWEQFLIVFSFHCKCRGIYSGDWGVHTGVFFVVSPYAYYTPFSI